MNWLYYIGSYVVLRGVEYAVDKLEPRVKKTKTKIDDHVVGFFKYLAKGIKLKKK